MIKSEQYVGPGETVIVITPPVDDASGYIPFSFLSTLGLAILQAATAAQVRAMITAAQAGANADISALLGLTTPVNVASGGTGANNPADARANLGISVAAFQGFTVESAAAAYGVTSSDVLIIANAAGGAFTITVPRALGSAGLTQMVFVMKAGNDQNPITIKDDAGAVKFTMVNGGQSFAFIAIAASTVTAAGVQ